MKYPRVTKGKKSHKILILLNEGPKTHGEIAKGLNIDEIKINHNYKELKEKKESGERKSPPRYSTKVYPGLSRVLSYMSRRYMGNPEDENFEDEYNPTIIYQDGKWYISKVGKDILQKLNED